MDWQMVLAGVTVCFVFVAAWYAWETRKHRLQMELQYQLSLIQWRVSTRPFIIPTISWLPREELIKMAHSGVIPDCSVRDIETEMADVDCGWECVLSNVTSNLAFPVWAVVYDGATENYCISRKGSMSVRGNEKDLHYLTGPRLSMKEATESAVRHFGKESGRFIWESLSVSPQDSVVAVLYADQRGIMHAVRSIWEYVSETGEISQQRPVHSDFIPRKQTAELAFR